MEVLANPVLVEVTRGAMVESRHRGAVAAVDAAGSLVFACGDVEAAIYPRSAIKPLQALALVETGAADAFGLGPEEIALACASHGGEPRHVALVARWLEKIGCTPSDLECGAQPPASEPAYRDLLRQGGEPGALHNNCSGKHAGFMTVARHIGAPVSGYIRFDHPVQRLVRTILSEVFGADLDAAPRGTDGCGIPVLATPLAKVARGMARMAAPEREPPQRREAMSRIRAAMAANPFLVAGTRRFSTRLVEALGETGLVKGGAEGCYCGILGGAGIGIALKIDDGAGRAAEVAMGAMLRRLGAIGDSDAARLTDALTPTLVNWAGREVGRIVPAAALRD